MKLCASQIGWAAEEGPAVLSALSELGFCGIEIAPTIAVGQEPYDAPQRAASFAADMKEKYGLSVCSMQSIWYGQSGSIFGAERQFFLEYTKKAFVFAQSMGCKNLVFGCPKNRTLPQGESADAAVPFFEELADAAARCHTVLALEANPEIYGTNFITNTPDAIAMVKRVNRPGFRLNLDIGTMLQNGESAQLLTEEVVRLVNHLHVSEPYLAAVGSDAARRNLHAEVAQRLRSGGYEGYVSIEQAKQPVETVLEVAKYVAEVFG